MIPIDGRISGSLIFQNAEAPVMPSHLASFEDLFGDRQQGRVDQHHRNADELPDRNKASVVRAYSSLPSQGANSDFSPTRPASKARCPKWAKG